MTKVSFSAVVCCSHTAIHECWGYVCLGTLQMHAVGYLWADILLNLWHACSAQTHTPFSSFFFWLCNPPESVFFLFVPNRLWFAIANLPQMEEWAVERNVWTGCLTLSVFVELVHVVIFVQINRCRDIHIYIYFFHFRAV